MTNGRAGPGGPVARVRGSRVADFAWGRGSRGAGRRSPATLPTLRAGAPTVNAYTPTPVREAEGFRRICTALYAAECEYAMQVFSVADLTDAMSARRKGPTASACVSVDGVYSTQRVFCEQNKRDRICAARCKLVARGREMRSAANMTVVPSLRNLRTRSKDRCVREKQLPPAKQRAGTPDS